MIIPALYLLLHIVIVIGIAGAIVWLVGYFGVPVPPRFDQFVWVVCAIIVLIMLVRFVLSTPL